MAINKINKKVAERKLIKIFDTKVSSSAYTDTEKQIDKVLDGYAFISIIGAEKVNETLQISGKVEYNLLYQDVDKNLNSCTTFVDFSDKVQVINAESYFVVPRLKKQKSTKVSVSSADFDLVIELLVYGLVEENVELVLPNNENCFEKTASYEVDKLVSRSNDTIALTDELEVNEALEKVLVNEASVVITKLKAFANYVTIDGKINREIVYFTGEHIRKAQKETEFTQEISLLNSVADGKLNVTAFVSSNLSNIQKTDENRGAIKFNTNLQINVVEFTSEKIETITDIYSTVKELAINSNCFLSTNFVSQKVFEDRTSFSVDTSKLKRMDETLCVVNSSFGVTQSVIENKMLSINGELSLSCFYKNYDSEELFVAKLDSPVTIQKVLEENECIDLGDLTIVPKLVNFKNRAGKELNLSYDFDVISDYVVNSQVTYVSNIEEKEEIKRDTHSILIFTPLVGQTPFDIAKELKTCPNAILAQNPNYDPDAPQKIVVYKART